MSKSIDVTVSLSDSDRQQLDKMEEYLYLVAAAIECGIPELEATQRMYHAVFGGKDPQ